MPRTLTVDSDGLALAVTERTDPSPGRAHVVLVHGYPDRQQVWDRVVAALPRGLHVVTYDVRGAGASGTPATPEGYRTEQLVRDLAAVVAATVPAGEPVHLVGHDWGSIQLWDAVHPARTDPRLAGRIASYTSISGPCLDHAAAVLRDTRGRELRALRQRLASVYLAVFLTPRLPELLWRTAGRLGLVGPGVVDDAVHGLELYRANLRRRPRPLHTDVAVLVVQPARDRFVTPYFAEDLDRRCTDLRLVRLDGAGHWAVRSHAPAVAALIAAHVAAHTFPPRGQRARGEGADTNSRQ